jgi:hypothetical protein
MCVACMLSGRGLRRGTGLGSDQWCSLPQVQRSGDLPEWARVQPQRPVIAVKAAAWMPC